MIRAVAILVTLASVLAVDRSLTGCSGPPAVSPVVEANLAAYAAEEQECVSLAGSRAAADVCIVGVKDRWCAPGQPLADAGACLVQFVDAGTVVILDATKGADQ
jgi:hypothetical protein